MRRILIGKEWKEKPYQNNFLKSRRKNNYGLVSFSLFAKYGVWHDDEPRK